MRKIIFKSCVYCMIMLFIGINGMGAYTRHKTALIVADHDQHYQDFLFYMNNKERIHILTIEAGLRQTTQIQNKSDMMRVTVTPQDKFVKTLNGGNP